jgi:lipoate-protein ligase A
VVSGLAFQDPVDDASQNAILSKALVNQRIYHIKDWRTTLKEASPSPIDVDDVGEWLNHIFGMQAPGVKGDRSLADATVELLAQTEVGRYLSRNTD